MNRLTIVNLVTGGSYAPVTDEDPAAFMAARVNAYGHPERRIAIDDLLARNEGAIFNSATMELVWPGEGVDEERRQPVADALPGWAWTAADGTEHPVILGGPDLVSDAQHTVEVEDLTDERRRRRFREARAAAYLADLGSVGDQLDAIYDELAQLQLNGQINLSQPFDRFLGRRRAVKNRIKLEDF